MYVDQPSCRKVLYAVVLDRTCISIPGEKRNEKFSDKCKHTNYVMYLAGRTGGGEGGEGEVGAGGPRQDTPE